MSDDLQKKIFSQNLCRYISLYDKTQLEIANAIGVSPQTFNTWCQGIALPRMGKVQLLADYFHINKSDLIDEHTDTEETYYINKETAQVAQEIFENKDLRVLFDAAKDSKPQDLQMAAEMLKRFKETNPDG